MYVPLSLCAHCFLMGSARGGCGVSGGLGPRQVTAPGYASTLLGTRGSGGGGGGKHGEVSAQKRLLQHVHLLRHALTMARLVLVGIGWKRGRKQDTEATNEIIHEQQEDDRTTEHKTVQNTAIHPERYM